MSNDDYIELNVDDDSNESHVSKKDILHFFGNLAVMPEMKTDDIYKGIINKNLTLPDFKFEEYFLFFAAYKSKEGLPIVIIKDVGSDNYYYIHKENVFKCDIYKAQQQFYGNIAQELGESLEDTHDVLIDKLGAYESILLLPHKQYLSTLDEFIEENIYMFDAALEEKSKSKNKIKKQVKMKG